MTPPTERDLLERVVEAAKRTKNWCVKQSTDDTWDLIFEDERDYRLIAEVYHREDAQLIQDMLDILNFAWERHTSQPREGVDAVIPDAFTKHNPGLAHGGREQAPEDGSTPKQSLEREIESALGRRIWTEAAPPVDVAAIRRDVSNARFSYKQNLETKIVNDLCAHIEALLAERGTR